MNLNITPGDVAYLRTRTQDRLDELRAQMQTHIQERTPLPTALTVEMKRCTSIVTVLEASLKRLA